MKNKVSKVSLIVYGVMLVISGFLASAAGDRVSWFCVMGAFAIPPIVLGSKYYKLIGIIALIVALVAICIDYRAGRRFHDSVIENHSQISTDAGHSED